MWFSKAAAFRALNPLEFQLIPKNTQTAGSSSEPILRPTPDATDRDQRAEMA